MIKRHSIYLLASALALIAASCASTGMGRPGWVDSPPADTQAAFIFVGAGSDPAGDEAAARRMAQGEVVSEITRFLGVKITAETTVEAKDAYGVFESNVTQRISESSRAKIGDLRVVDSYIDRGPGGVTVFLLAEYDRGALLEEKARLEAVFAEQVEAVSGPEGEGNSLMTRGEYYRAALKYGEAALAAVSSDLDNAAIKFERNLNNTKEALSRIRLIGLNDNLTVMLNSSMDEPFRLKVTGGADRSDPGIEGVDIRISYKVARSNGRLSPKSEYFRTDGDGMVAFRRPPAGFVGAETVTMSIDFRSVLEPLSEIPDPFYAQVEGLEQVLSQKRTVFQYEIISTARDVPTAVLLMDRDRGGNPLERTDTASGFLEVLTGQGFQVSLLDLSADYIGLSERELLNRLIRQWGDKYERIILGFASIDSFEEADGAAMVLVSGEAKAVDLSSGTILYSASGSSRARSTSQTGTITAAFKKLGQSLGR